MLIFLEKTNTFILGFRLILEGVKMVKVIYFMVVFTKLSQNR